MISLEILSHVVFVRQILYCSCMQTFLLWIENQCMFRFHLFCFHFNEVIWIIFWFYKNRKKQLKKRKVRHKSWGRLWDDLDEMSGLLTHLFVTTVTCIDPSCSGNGLCHLGKCVCYKGFKGDHCQLPDKLNLTHLCARDCSGHGQFDWDTGQCICQRFFTGKDCETGKGSCLKIPRLTQFFVALTYFCQSWTQ